MNHLRVIGIYFLMSLSVVSCASLVDKGNELYQQGLYQEAASFFEQALTKDPQDVEAKIGLANARLKMIDRGLIDVRMMREGANFKAAATKLETILENQSLWNVEISGNIAFTQNEEVKLAGRWVQDEISRISKSRFPDQLAWHQFFYKNIITNAGLTDWVIEKELSVSNNAKKMCTDLIAAVDGQEFYLKNFSIAYCSRWGVNRSITLSNRDTERYSQFFVRNNVRLSRQNKILMRDAIEEFSLSIQQAWESTPWFNPSSQQNLSTKLLGDIFYSHKKYRSQRVANYQVVNSITNQNTGQVSQQTVDKKHRYYVTEHREKLSLALKLTTQLANRPYQFAMNDSKTNNSLSHNEDFDAANLQPQSAQLIAIDDWLDTKMRKMVNGIKQEANKRWEQRYCLHPPTVVSEIESALRCGKLIPTNKKINNLFERKFGISFQQLQQLQPME